MENELLGLHYAIWAMLVVYFTGILLMGWWCRRSAKTQEGYLVADRRFGVGMMVMHAFGAGTNPSDVAGVMSKTVASGASGIWLSWMWMFGTPFYWLIAPIVRRMRYLTLADYFQERYNKAATLLYVVVATVGMTVFMAGMLLATTRTVQAVMGKAIVQEGMDWWFLGILLFMTAIFMLYSFWGGIVAAIRTDMVQGLMIIALSFIAIPAALKLREVGGMGGMRDVLSAVNGGENHLLNLAHPEHFSLLTVILLCINAPLSMMAQPHLMTVCAAGKTEWEGRVGFTFGNVLKRICTMGWCVLALCWLVHLMKTGVEIHPDAAFGDSIRALLSPALQGLMLACVMAAAMSSGDAVQVTVAGLFSQNVYKVFVNPEADDKRVLHVTKITGLVIVVAGVALAILMRKDMVKAILDYFNITSLVGISVVMGILWRRMNSAGMFTGTILAVAVFITTRYILESDRWVTILVPITTGVAGGVIGSLLTARPKQEMLDKFFKKIYTPIGEEEKLELPFDEAVPPSKRLITAGGLLIMKPSRQSWVGFLVTLGICLGCVATMLALLKV